MLQEIKEKGMVIGCMIGNVEEKFNFMFQLCKYCISKDECWIDDPSDEDLQTNVILMRPRPQVEMTKESRRGEVESGERSEVRETSTSVRGE